MIDEELQNIAKAVKYDLNSRTLWERSSKLQKLHRVKEKSSLVEEIRRLKDEHEEMKDTQHSKIMVLENDLKKMTSKKIKSEARVKILESEAQQREEYYCNLQLESQVDKYREKLTEQQDQFDIEKQELNNRLQEYRDFANLKIEYEKKIKQLEFELAEEKRLHKENLQQSERERIQDNERNQKNMLYKIKATKQELLSLTDQQLHTTTRLTVLENHRLTTELEYQSKQTEKFLARNQQLEEMVNKLKQEIEIHQGVENELAKRSQFCQKIISKLNDKIKYLEQNIQDYPQPIESNQHNQVNDDLIKFLEQKLEETMNRMAYLQQELNQQRKIYQEAQQQIQEKNTKYHTLGELLSNYLKDLKTTTPALLQDENMILNIQNIANTDPEHLDPMDRAALITVLLKQIQPYLSPNNLLIPEISQVNIIQATAEFSNQQRHQRSQSKPVNNTAVQTSFAMGTFDLPKLEIDAQMIKGPVRPWGRKVYNNTAKLLSTSFTSRHRRQLGFLQQCRLEQMNTESFIQQQGTTIKNHITERTLHERAERLQFLFRTIDKLSLESKNEQLKKDYEEMKDTQHSKILVLEADLKRMTGKKIKSEARVKILEQEAIQKEDYYCKLQLESQIEKYKEKLNQQKDKYEIEIMNLNNRIQEFREFINQKSEYEQKVENLELELEKQIKRNNEANQQAEREKIELKELYEKKMLYKIKSNKNDITQLTDKQLHTTTRLTVLENHRLTTELEYQSKLTEKFLQKNEELEKLVQKMKQEDDINQGIQSEMAKRTQYSQRIIRNLQDKIEKLQGSLAQQEQTEKQANNYQMNEDLISFLEQKLEETMNRMAQLQMELNQLNKQYQESQQRLFEKHSKYRTLGDLLADYLKDIQNSNPDLISDENIILNLSTLTTVDPEHLDTIDRAALVTVLLKQIQPYLSPSNLIIPEISQINIVSNQQNQPILNSRGQITPLRKSREDSQRRHLTREQQSRHTTNAAIQTSFAMGTFDLPRIDIDAEMVKGPVRPWGKKVAQPKSAKALSTSFTRNRRRM